MTKALPKPPSVKTIERNLLLFADDVARRYGARLQGVYLFGSRAHGCQQPDSDADVAVVLFGAFDMWTESNDLSDLAYEYFLRDGTEIDVKPVTAQAWERPAVHANPALLHAMRRDAKSLLVTA